MKNRFSDTMNAFQPSRRDVRLLKEKGIGDVGIVVRYTKKKRLPVVYIWQAFTYVRLEKNQITAVRDRLDAILSKK